VIEVIIRDVEIFLNFSVGIATDYRLDDRGLIPGRGKIFLFSTPNLLSNGYRGLFLRG
jgi:hypothetical protein